MSTYAPLIRYYNSPIRGDWKSSFTDVRRRVGAIIISSPNIARVLDDRYECSICDTDACVCPFDSELVSECEFILQNTTVREDKHLVVTYGEHGCVRGLSD